MPLNRKPESLTLEDLPGADPARFEEWKRLHRRARIAPHYGLLAWASAFITVPVVGGGIGWLLPVVFYMTYMFAYVGPLSRAENRLAAELGVPAALGLPATGGSSRTRLVIKIVLIVILVQFALGIIYVVVMIALPKKETPPVSVGTEVVADTNWSVLAEPFEVHLKGSEILQGARVQPQFFEVAGAKPHIGRFFLAEEYEVAAPVVVISFHMWQLFYNNDPSVLGRSVQINGRDVTIVGVGPLAFLTPFATHLWTPAGSASKITP